MTSADPEPASALCARVLHHLLDCVRLADVHDEPFTHLWFVDVFPADVYADLLSHLPPAERYQSGPPGPHTHPGARTLFNLTTHGVRSLPTASRNLWRGVAAALTDPELKRGLFAKLAPDLMLRYGVKGAEVPDLAGHPRPTLFRDDDGFELPPHPDTPKKVVTLHLYLPADLSQLHLGTSLYRRNTDTEFTRVKSLEFRPNSGYAFVVSDRGPRASWHGCERLPGGAGVRLSLLNTFYAHPRAGYAGYLEGEATGND
jgi:hypothetical protein